MKLWVEARQLALCIMGPADRAAGAARSLAPSTSASTAPNPRSSTPAPGRGRRSGADGRGPAGHLPRHPQDPCGHLSGRRVMLRGWSLSSERNWNELSESDRFSLLRAAYPDRTRDLLRHESTLAWDKLLPSTREELTRKRVA